MTAAWRRQAVVCLVDIGVGERGERARGYVFRARKKKTQIQISFNCVCEMDSIEDLVVSKRLLCLLVM